MRTLFYMGILILLLLAACRDFVSLEDDGLERALIEVGWELTSFQQADGVRTTVGSQGMTLTFLDDGHLEGRLYTIDTPKGPDHVYEATYEVFPDGSLSIAVPQLRNPAGAISNGSRWQEYRRALSRATTYEMEGNRLRIYYDGTWALNFRKRL